jgi:hypothetical protein
MWLSTRWVRIHQLLPGSFALFSMIVRSTGLLPAPFDLSFANVPVKQGADADLHQT